MKVNAILLKPLDGFSPGSPRQFDQTDFDRLAGMGAVRAAGVNDAVEEPRDETIVLLLDQLRSPVDGPRLLAEMKASADRQRGEIEQLSTALSASTTRIDQLVKSHDEVIADRDAVRADYDAAIIERDDARDAVERGRSDRDAMQVELDDLRANAAAPTKPGKAK